MRTELSRIPTEPVSRVGRGPILGPIPVLRPVRRQRFEHASHWFQPPTFTIRHEPICMTFTSRSNQSITSVNVCSTVNEATGLNLCSFPANGVLLDDELTSVPSGPDAGMSTSLLEIIHISFSIPFRPEHLLSYLLRTLSHIHPPLMPILHYRRSLIASEPVIAPWMPRFGHVSSRLLRTRMLLLEGQIFTHSRRAITKSGMSSEMAGGLFEHELQESIQGKLEVQQSRSTPTSTIRPLDYR